MRIHISQLQVSHGSGWRQDCHLEVSLGLLDSGGSPRDVGDGLSSSDGGDSNGEETSEGTDHGGVIDDMLGDVVGHVLLDSDLGHVVDGVVNVVADMLDNGGSGIGDRCGVVSGNSGDRFNLGGGGGDGVGSRSGDNLRGSKPVGDVVGSNSRGDNPWVVVGSNSGGGDNKSVVDDRDNSLADGVNKAVLVEVLGESLEGE